MAELQDPKSVRAKVFAGFQRLLRARAENAAFHPKAAQNVLHLEDHVFAIQRGDSSHDAILCLHNVSCKPITVDIDPSLLPLVDLLSPERRDERASAVQLAPYETAWLAGVRA
jgi:sucrose phosphorylase